MTKVASSAGPDTVNLIAVNQRFIAYGLKPGHIRVIERASGARTLLKGHSGGIHDIKCGGGVGGWGWRCGFRVVEGGGMWRVGPKEGDDW